MRSRLAATIGLVSVLLLGLGLGPALAAVTPNSGAPRSNASYLTCRSGTYTANYTVYWSGRSPHQVSIDEVEFTSAYSNSTRVKFNEWTSVAFFQQGSWGVSQSPPQGWAGAYTITWYYPQEWHPAPPSDPIALQAHPVSAGGYAWCTTSFSF